MKWLENKLQQISIKTKFGIFLSLYSLVLSSLVLLTSNIDFLGASDFSHALSHFLFALPVILWASHAVGAHFSVPLKTLIQSSNKTSKGNLNAHISHHRQDEFSAVFESFNYMLDELRNYKKLEQESKEKTREFAQISEESPNPTARINEQAQLIYMNPSALKLASHFELGIGDTVPEIFLQRLNKSTGQVRLEAGPQTFEVYSSLAANRKTVNLYAWDVSKQVVAEAESLKAVESATALSDTKSKFLATMSHEIRTPMNGIIGLSGMLADTNLDSEQKKLNASVLSSATSLLNIINDVLDFSKIEAGKMKIDFVAVDISELLRESVELLQITNTKKNLALSIHIEDTVPDLINTDPNRIRQILINLVGNALKFTEEGYVKVICKSEEVSSSAQTPSFRILFEVEDSGMGIPAELQNKLFQDFSQVDGSITRQFGGTGLGLSICKTLVELLGGNIRVESQPGKGSSFQFSILAHRAEKIDPAENDLPDYIIDKSFAYQHPIRIAVAEDNTVNQMVIKRFLAKLGYSKISIFENGSEIFEASKNTAFDLVFMDMEMPVMNGVEATYKILENGSMANKPRIVAMTANARAEDREICEEAGMSGFITKPLKLDQLAQEVFIAYEEHINKAA